MKKYFILTSLVLTLQACATNTQKPIVNEPLTLSGPNDIKKHVCGEMGCDDVVKQMCGTKTTKIILRNFVDNSRDVKNQTTGTWKRNKDQRTYYHFRCID